MVLAGHYASPWNYHVSIASSFFIAGFICTLELCWIPSLLKTAFNADRVCSSITGTPAGIGWGRNPKLTLHGGDEFVVEILPKIGSLHNVLEDEK